MTVPGNAYPAVQLDSRGQVVDSGVVLQFTDDSDQPGSGGGSQPFSDPVSITDSDSPYAASAGQLILVDASNDNVEIDLPASPPAGTQIAIWAGPPDPDGDTITVSPAGGATIDGADNYVLILQYQVLVLLFDGTDWIVTSDVGSEPLPAPLAGSGPPNGQSTAVATGVGQFYVDTHYAALWIAGATGNEGWISVGGYAGSGAPGVILDPAAGSFFFADTAGNNVPLRVFTAAAGGTTMGSVETNLNTLDDGNAGTATFAGGVILPTADPHVAGAWWDDAGTLTKSAG